MNYGKVLFIYVLITIWSFASISSAMFSIVNAEASGQEGGLLHHITVFCQILLEIIAVTHLVLHNRRLNKTGTRIVLWVLYAILITIFQHTELITDIRIILWWPSVYLLFYAISSTDTGRYKELLLNVFVPIIYLGCSAIFVVLRLAMFNVFSFYTASNDIYYIILLLPFIIFLKNRGLRYFCLILGILLALYSFKRGAQLCVILSLLLYVLIDMKSSSMSVFKKIMYLIVITGSVIVLFFYVNSKTEGYIVERFDEIEESGGSGRESIYTSVIKEFRMQDGFNQIFGIGLNGVKNHFHVTNVKDGRSYSAHNDFLEMMVDYGYIGLVLYLLLLFSVFGEIRYCKKTGILSLYQSGLMGVSMFLIMSTISHLFLYPTFVAYSFMLFGIIGGYCKMYRSQSRRIEELSM